MAITPRPNQTATAPINTTDENDIEEGKRKLDEWIRELTGGAIGWETVYNAGSIIPGVGSIFSAIDAVSDILTLIDGDRSDFLTWVSLGINVIGLVPFGGVGPARLALRSTLATIRRNGINELAAAMLAALQKNLNEKAPGELEKFAEEVEERLNEFLVQVTEKIQEVAADLSSMLRFIASDEGQQVLIKKSKWVKLASFATGMVGAAATHYLVGDRQLNNQTRDKILQFANKIDEIATQAFSEIMEMTDPDVAGSIASLITALITALSAKKGRGIQATAHSNRSSRAQHSQNQDALVTRGSERPATKDPNCRNGTASDSGCSISFATGSEKIEHTDFILPGVFPLEWRRTYRSSLSSMDMGPFGARWITPFSLRIDESEKGELLYHGLDGRSHTYAPVGMEKHHYDNVEGLLIVRPCSNTLVIGRGRGNQEHYHKYGNSYHLAEIRLQGGAKASLHYEHYHNDTKVLSDIVTYQGNSQHSHLHLRHDDNGHISSIWLMKDGTPHRQIASYSYDEHGDLRGAEDEHGHSWSYSYNHHLVTRYTDRTSRGMNLEWLGDGPDAKAVREWADDGSYDTKLEWDRNIRLTYITNALNQETWHYYDALGFTYRIIHPDGNEEWFYRDNSKNLIQHIHTDGSTHRYAYDERGNLLQHMRPDGTSVHHAYDNDDQLLKTRDAEGGLWRYEYDQHGNIIESVDPLENKTQYSFNSNNLLISSTDANGAESTLTYNENCQITGITDCSGKTTQWKYDSIGQLYKTINALGETLEYHYESGQLARVVHPDKSEERFEKDAEGRLLKHTDALHRKTQWFYNEAGMLQQRLSADGSTLHYHWDQVGQLIRLQNENNSEANFKYDPAGHLLKETGFDKETTHYLYDHGSQFPTRRLEGDRTTHFEYDAMGRLTQRKAGQRDGEEWEVENFSYDGNGNLSLAENQDCKLHWFYDTAGNLVREHQYFSYMQRPRVSIFTHEYDALNQRIATVRPDGHRVSWLTYGSGHLIGLKIDEQELVSYQRDDLHRETERTQANGLIQRQSWTPNGQLLEQTLARSGEQKRIAVRTYSYDASGQLTRVDDLNRGFINYRYDPIGRLLEAGDYYKKSHFSFDPASNLLDPDAPPGPNPHSPRKINDNVLRSYCGTQYRYDERGNLIERIENGNTGKFVWDLFDRLRRYEDDKLVADFAYDALGRRLYKNSRSKYRNRSQAGPVWNENARRELDEQLGCGYTYYGWDGDTLAFECRDRDGEGTTTHYVFEPGTFIPVAQAVSNSTIELLIKPNYSPPYRIDRDPIWQGPSAPKPFDAFAWYQCDHLGTPMELTDALGTIAWSATYNTWGLAKATRSEAANRNGIDNPLRFQGQYYDIETGLHYNWHRYYDPSIGRFIGKDPIGFIGGLNVYLYARNTVQWIDPYGLLCRSNLRKALLQGQNGDQMQAHHLIPVAKWDAHEDFLKKIEIYESRDKKENGVLVPSSEAKARAMKRMFYHCGSHEFYSTLAGRQLAKIRERHESGEITDFDAKAQISALQIRLRTILLAPGKGQRKIR